MDLRHRIARPPLSGLVVGMADLARSLVDLVRNYAAGSSVVVVVDRRAAEVRIGNIHLPCRRGLAGRLDLTLSRFADRAEVNCRGAAQLMTVIEAEC